MPRRERPGLAAKATRREGRREAAAMASNGEKGKRRLDRFCGETAKGTPGLSQPLQRACARAQGFKLDFSRVKSLVLVVPGALGLPWKRLYRRGANSGGSIAGGRNRGKRKRRTCLGSELGSAETAERNPPVRFQGFP